VGARAIHVLANFSYYESDPGQVFAIWNGGLSSYGGLLGGIPTGLILAKKRCPSLPSIKAMDLVCPVLMAAWGVGRLLGPQLMVSGGGNATKAWYGMYYAGEVGKRVPVPIFQSIESFVIFGILIYLERRFSKRPNGFILAATMALWGLERFVEENLWLKDTSHIGQYGVQATGLVLFAAGVITMVVLLRRFRRHEEEHPNSEGGDPVVGTSVDGDSGGGDSGDGEGAGGHGAGTPDQLVTKATEEAPA
jgi:phosphatidylglycerol:prolipoprotein diacylglycerol transferase